MRTWRRVRAWLAGHPLWGSVLLAVLVLVLAGTVQRPPTEPPFQALSAGGWVLLVLSCAALVLRLGRPLPVWVVTLVLTLSGAVLDRHVDRAILPQLVAVYTVATRLPRRTAVLAALTSATVLGTAGVVLSSEPMVPDTTYALLAFLGMATAVGLAVRSQRDVVAAAHERARIAELTREEEAQRRVAEERLRIARELHDVVAHHISVINVQAGVARHLLAADPDAAGAALGNVRQSAAVVLREMGSILGLLRTTEDEAGTAPAPGADRIEELVDGGRRAGLLVDWSVTGSARPLTPAADLAAYRLVQEALTNARKHGRGQVRLTMHWAPDELAIDIRNPLGDKRTTAAAAAPGGGHGVVGMRERVAAAGGRLVVEPSGEDFVVRAGLPYEQVDAAASASGVAPERP